MLSSGAMMVTPGGYYMAMAAQKIVAEPLTITGSIGVITGKFNLAELYRRAGYAKTSISRGRHAVWRDWHCKFRAYSELVLCISEYLRLASLKTASRLAIAGCVVRTALHNAAFHGVAS